MEQEVKEEVKEVVEVKNEIAETQIEVVVDTTQETKAPTNNFEDLLKTNKEFASEHDRRISKAIATALEKKNAEYEILIKTEQEKLENTFNEKSVKLASEYESKEKEYIKQIDYSKTTNKALTRGVKADNLNDFITLSQTYVNEENDIDKAMETIIEKYPHFVGTSTQTLKVGRENKSITTDGKTIQDKWLAERKKK